MMQKKLKNLLKKAKAPITGRKIACYILGEKGEEYSGYNIETKKRILHAEEDALASVQGNFRLKEIHLMSSGSPMNVKYAMPCEKCSNILFPYSTTKSEIIFYFNNGPKKFRFNFRKLISAYASFSNSLELKGNITSFLKNNTPLTKIDRTILANMYKSILIYNSYNPNPTGFYITGSSSGRGGPKSILAKKITGVPYWDIDLILIFSKKTPKDINRLIKDIYQNVLNFAGFEYSRILEKDMPSYALEENKKDSKKFIFRKVYWAEGMNLEIQPPNYKKIRDTPSTIDISVGKSLKSTITSKYLKKNWYIKLI